MNSAGDTQNAANLTVADERPRPASLSPIPAIKLGNLLDLHFYMIFILGFLLVSFKLSKLYIFAQGHLARKIFDLDSWSPGSGFFPIGTFN